MKRQVLRAPNLPTKSRNSTAHPSKKEKKDSNLVLMDKPTPTPKQLCLNHCLPLQVSRWWSYLFPASKTESPVARKSEGEKGSEISKGFLHVRKFSTRFQLQAKIPQQNQAAKMSYWGSQPKQLRSETTQRRHNHILCQPEVQKKGGKKGINISLNLPETNSSIFRGYVSLREGN